jgi:hypothetical protein
MDKLITKWDLIDIKPLKEKCTWSNNRTALVLIVEKLDNFLVQSDLLLHDSSLSCLSSQAHILTHKQAKARTIEQCE